MSWQKLKVSRPVSVTIIGWLFIVGGVLGVLATMSLLKDLQEHRLDLRNFSVGGQPPTKGVVQLLLWANTFISAAFGVCGQMFLNGRREARQIYMSIIGVSFVLSVATLGLAGLIYSIPSILYHSIVLFFLFRAPADAFFLGLVQKPSLVVGNQDERSVYPARTYGAILLLLVAVAALSFSAWYATFVTKSLEGSPSTWDRRVASTLKWGAVGLITFGAAAGLCGANQRRFFIGVALLSAFVATFLAIAITAPFFDKPIEGRFFSSGLCYRTLGVLLMSIELGVGWWAYRTSKPFRIKPDVAYVQPELLKPKVDLNNLKFDLPNVEKPTIRKTN